jgi:hypothetical protein
MNYNTIREKIDNGMIEKGKLTENKSVGKFKIT